MKRLIFICFIALISCQIAISQIIPAAERINVYMPFLKNKKVGIFANHTSTVGSSHLVDTLQKLGVDIRVIFGPEHGFSGNVPDGVKNMD